MVKTDFQTMRDEQALVALEQAAAEVRAKLNPRMHFFTNRQTRKVLDARRERRNAGDHACDACGGSGEETRPKDWAREEWRTRIYTGKAPACPVCLGAGQFSDVMPVADALADAETLRSTVPGDVGGPLVDASLLGDVVRRRVRAREAEYAGNSAAKAARAAFRAVPGLKGK